MKIRWNNNNIVTLAFKLLNGGLKRVEKENLLHEQNITNDCV